MRSRCGICGFATLQPFAIDRAGHDLAKHDLFERMKASPNKIEPLSPLAKDLGTANASEKARKQ